MVGSSHSRENSQGNSEVLFDGVCSWFFAVNDPSVIVFLIMDCMDIFEFLFFV
jgi:hypothetical protein